MNMNIYCFGTLVHASWHWSHTYRHILCMQECTTTHTWHTQPTLHLFVARIEASFHSCFNFSWDIGNFDVFVWTQFPNASPLLQGVHWSRKSCYDMLQFHRCLVICGTTGIQVGKGMKHEKFGSSECVWILPNLGMFEKIFLHVDM